jgi:hypothetical protein
MHSFQYLQSLPKANQHVIPSVAFLYGNAVKQTPHIQAGFIYKARPENINKDSYPVSATMFPIFNRPDGIAKYPQYQKPSSPPLYQKVKHFTPFLPENQVSGIWHPVNLHHHDHFVGSNGKPTYVKGQVLDIPITR